MAQADGANLKIVTVNGPIDPRELGVTLSHDHLLVDAWGMTPGYEDYGTILDNEDLAIEEMKRYRRAGGSALCDPTTVGIGRNPGALRRISRASGVHIVMGCGWYRERVYPPYVFQEQPDRLADRLVQELTEGVDGTWICPGFIRSERNAFTSPPRKSASFGLPRARSAALGARS